MFVQKLVQVNNSICGKGNHDLGWSKYFRFNYLTTVLLHNILNHFGATHYSDVTMSSKASQITGIPSVSSTVCSGAYHRKHQSSSSLTFVRGIHRWPVDSPSKRASKSENASIWWHHHLDMHWQWVRQHLDDKQWDILWFSIKGTEAYYLLIGPRSVTRINKISSADLNDVIWSIKAVLNHVWP